MGAIKIIKVIDYVGDYYILFGDGKSWYGIVFISPGGQWVCDLHGYQAHNPAFTRNVRWTFLLFQDGVSLACSFPPSTPVLLPEKSHGQRGLVGYSPWGRKESDMTEAT